jgi:hypothetical protein
MGRKRIKQYLMLLLAIGVIAVVASGSGTFASFTASTTNANNVFSTGQILLHNTANGGTVCTSETGVDNAKSCTSLFNTTIKPGDVKHAYLVLTNAGNLTNNGIKFYRGTCNEAPPVLGNLNGAASGSISGTIAVKAPGLTQALVAGTPITVDDGTNPAVTLHVATAGAASGATSIPVTETSWANSVNDDAKITINTSAFTSSPGLCSGLHFNIEERSADMGGGTKLGCAWGNSTTPPDCDTDGTYVLNHPTTSSSTPDSLSLATSPNGNTGGALSPGKSRYFDLIVTADNTLGNSAQNDALSFDLTWQITAS